ncbi:triosephosphate isomerase [Buchnera aphidicola str. Ak (Acyrthosiphon kondoi)]|uniref:Triosephosphate isomerase n=1 Tax=Buchnera aphidicola str. Ak (Acyrthosiphon kondoi) TaxID=1005090 RepID=G2LN21_9GAMM|nr:triose-phosphate isomerase [Buchnera aphidicola]AEO08659.1 triosephosphate isomerase [Buchnera aphidicola str. Ak (Acyrthosiphon kondoi)]
MKKFFIAANWKLNGNINMISNFFKYLKLQSSIHSKKNTIIIAPPTIYLERVYKDVSNMNIFLGAQNIDIHLKGAFTGETSVLMLEDIGVKYVIIGHSERRLMHNETNDIIIKKFHLIKESNLIPILCIGETEIDKKNGKTQEVITEQLHDIFKKIGKSAFKNTIIAYEPIWAIGTGLSAEPKDVQLIHKFIKNYIVKHDSIDINDIIVQYGGSINYSNAKKFMEQPDINGLLIGNASLDPAEFCRIIKISDHIL